MNRLDNLFATGKRNLLNIYCTAGFPEIDSTLKVLQALEDNGADIAEIGMPYSDPLADGPVIQQSNKTALENGMTISLLFEQLENLRPQIKIPVILMGYLNPVLQYGVEKFCEAAMRVGVDGLIIPDLPVHEFTLAYKAVFEKYNLRFTFLVTPETAEDRIRLLDKSSSGFLYAVSSSSTTGSGKSLEEQAGYLGRLRDMQLSNPVLVGFGISDAAGFRKVCEYARGAIVGSAYIRALQAGGDIGATTRDFLNGLNGR